MILKINYLIDLPQTYLIGKKSGKQYLYLASTVCQDCGLPGNEREIFATHTLTLTVCVSPSIAKLHPRLLLAKCHPLFLPSSISLNNLPNEPPPAEWPPYALDKTVLGDLPMLHRWCSISHSVTQSSSHGVILRPSPSSSSLVCTAYLDCRHLAPVAGGRDTRTGFQQFDYFLQNPDGSADQ